MFGLVSGIASSVPNFFTLAGVKGNANEASCDSGTLLTAMTNVVFPTRFTVQLSHVASSVAIAGGVSTDNNAGVMHPFGRLAMTRAEKRNAFILGGTLAAGVALLASAFAVESGLLLILGVVFVAVTIPLVGMLNAATPKARLIAGGVIVCILALVFLGLFSVPGLFGVAAIVWLAYIWVIGQYVSRH